jgi:putative flippase GtrA
MFEKLIQKIVSIFPKRLQDLYYKYESMLLYIFFGGLTTIVSIATQYIADYLGANTALATTISWICAVTFAFFTNKSCVFKSKTETKTDFFKQMLAFYGARLVSYFLEMGFMILTVDIFHLKMHIMKIIAQVFILTINYLFSKLVIFRKK